MSQPTDIVIANDTHANVRADINAVFAGVVSMFSGSSAPSTTYPHQFWADTTGTPTIISIRNAGDSAWSQLFTDTGLFRSEDGGASSVAYGPASDIDTGRHFATAATITDVTAGTERVHMSATETVFNETGVDTDFRVEASGVASAFFVQGSDGKIGIGTGAPSYSLHAVADAANCAIAASSASSGSTASGRFTSRRSRGTHASPSAVVDNDYLAYVEGYGYHSTGTPGFTAASYIALRVDGTPSGNFVPGDIAFFTGTDAAAASERMTIGANGYVGIGKSNGGSALVEIAGTAGSVGQELIVEHHSNDGLPSVITTRKSRGTSTSSPAAIQAGDIVGWWSAEGYYNSGWRGAGSLSFLAHTVSGSVIQAHASISTYNSSGTLVPRYVNGEYVTLTDGVATTLFTAACANNTAAGFVLNYCVEARDASNEIQMESGSVNVAIVNTGGTVTTTVGTASTANRVTSGTLAVTVAASAANPSVISINANTSLTSTLLRCIYSVTNLSDQTLTI